MNKIIKMREKPEYILGLRNLCSFLVNNNVKNIVEIGSYTGESAIIFSEYFENVVCIDSWCSDYNEYELTAKTDFLEVEKLFDSRVLNYKNIHKIKKSSVEASSLFENNSLEFVYVDASHKYDHVIQDLNSWTSKIKNGFFIGGHDYDNILDGHVEVKKAVDLFFVGKEVVTFIDTSWVVKL